MKMELKNPVTRKHKRLTKQNEPSRNILSGLENRDSKPNNMKN